MTAYTYAPSKPKTAANYALIGNPLEHFYRSRNLPILFGVNHITAGITDLVGTDSSADNTNRWGAATSTTASWHGILDSDSIHDSLPDEYTAFAQGLSGHSFNSPAIALEVGLRDPDWRILPATHRDAIVANMARWWAPRVIRHGLVVRYYTDREEIDWLISRKQKFGFTDHWMLNPAMRRDPGRVGSIDTFPRAQFLDGVNREVSRLKGTPKPVPAPYVPPTATTKLVLDGRMGPATVRRWQQVMKAAGYTVTVDGVISVDGSQLVTAVQHWLNKRGMRDGRGRALALDGKGILPNLSRSIGPTNTIYAMQRYLGTSKDGVLSTPSSNAVEALQARLNANRF